jgi:uncharacterized protein with GYD domain
MPKFLVHAAYTAEGARGILKGGGSARRKAVEELLASVGGKLEAFYFSFGDEDAILIVDLPDNEAALSIGMAVSASGAVRSRATVLIPIEEVDRRPGRSNIKRAAEVPRRSISFPQTLPPRHARQLRPPTNVIGNA